jgi:hypothetical protein
VIWLYGSIEVSGCLNWDFVGLWDCRDWEICFFINAVSNHQTILASKNQTIINFGSIFVHCPITNNPTTLALRF